MAAGTKMIDIIQREFMALNISNLVMAILALFPYALGWLAGFMVRLLLWLLAAFVAGYKVGRGQA